MSNRFELPDEIRSPGESRPATRDSDRALRDFRYVVMSVDEDASRVWSELWEQLKSGVTPAGMVLPQLEEGFKPECGWAEFLEKFWLLKHYLDYIHRFCKGPGGP